MVDAIVCGSGAAGLAAATMLRRAGVDTLVIERSDRIAASWRSRYATLRLNITGSMSTHRATERHAGVTASFTGATSGFSISRTTTRTINSTCVLAQRCSGSRASMAPGSFKRAVASWTPGGQVSRVGETIWRGCSGSDLDARSRGALGPPQL